MFSLLKSNDPRILNYSSDSDVRKTLNYIAENDPNVFYITIEYEGNSYFIIQHNFYKGFKYSTI